MKRAKQILALLIAMALLFALGGAAEEVAPEPEVQPPVAEAAPEPEPEPQPEPEPETEPEPEAAPEPDEAPEPEARPEEAAPEPEAAPEEAQPEEAPKSDAPADEIQPAEASAEPRAEDDEEELIIYPSTLTMTVGESGKQKITGIADKKFTYRSSNAGVVAVNASGKLTAKKTGTATITVTGKTTRRSVKCKVTVKPAPLDIWLNKDSGKLDIDDELQLTATISPLSAPKGIKWTSSNEHVATVEDGLVTALRAGSATITATCVKRSEAGVKVSDSFKLTVVDPSVPSDFYIEGKPNRKVNLQDSLSLEVVIEPDTAETELKWTSSNEKIATVEDGEVTPLKEGTVTITAKTTVKGQSGKKLSDSVTVTVVDPAKPADVTILVDDERPKKPVIVELGDTLALDYSLTNSSDEEAESDVTWISSNKKIARISEDGELEARRAGTVTVTVKTTKKGAGGFRLKDSIKVVVIDPSQPVSIELDQTGTVTLEQGEELALEAIITPDTASDAELTWTSSNKKVAKVNQDGEVTAKKPGTAKITVKSKNGKKASVKIKVIAADDEE